MKRSFSYILAGLLISGSLFGGTISGKIRNGSKGQGIPENLTVRLFKIPREGDETAKRVLSAALPARGSKFLFSNVPFDSTAIFLPEVEYRGVKYYGDSVWVSSGNSRETSNIIVYDTTASDSALSILSHHLLIEPQGKFVLVEEIIVVENSGDRTFLGNLANGAKTHPDFYFQLPEKATNLVYVDLNQSKSFEKTDGGFYDKSPFLPGRKQYRFAYDLPSPNPSLSFAKIITLPTRKLDIIPMDSTLIISGANFDVFKISDTPISAYQLKNLPTRRQINIEIAGLRALPTNLTFWFLIGFVLVLLMSAGFFARALIKKNLQRGPEKVPLD